MAILKPTLEVLAQHLMFSSDRSTQSFLNLMETEGVEFRKNKSITNIEQALEKAKLRKNGHGRVELEQGMLESYLEDILKGNDRIKRGVSIRR